MSNGVNAEIPIGAGNSLQHVGNGQTHFRLWSNEGDVSVAATFRLCNDRVHFGVQFTVKGDQRTAVGLPKQEFFFLRKMPAHK